LKTSDFSYVLPEELIAQTPVMPRDHSRMLVYDRADGSVKHLHFYDLPQFSDSRGRLGAQRDQVIPARLLGEKEKTGVPVEILLLKRESADVWETLVRPGRRLLPGATCVFGEGLLRAEILSTLDTGGRRVRFRYQGVFEELLDRLGEMPLPPYIHEHLVDQTRYQTVYAKEEGSAAAPTAGLHFTPELLGRVRDMGVNIVPIVLHVGLGTFRPVKAENVEDHVMHVERYEVPPEAAAAINAARAGGHRCVCVGTTSVRTLRDGGGRRRRDPRGQRGHGHLHHPRYRYRAVDTLITNFHLPESTLLMLVSAFMGREEALRVYQIAVREKYRFFSFGDCMLIL
jgi:S-adenosylmethionine:tRNA ribosyltransferase-isomerase